MNKTGSLGAALTAGGVIKSYGTGRSMAGNTANRLSVNGHKTKNEELARNIGGVTGVVGGLAGAGLAFHNLEKIHNTAHKYLSPGMANVTTLLAPAGAAVVGGMGAGWATGALTSLKGRFKKKEASEKIETYMSSKSSNKRALIAGGAGVAAGVGGKMLYDKYKKSKEKIAADAKPIKRTAMGALIGGGLPIAGGALLGGLGGGPVGAIGGAMAGAALSPMTGTAGAMGGALKSYIIHRRNKKSLEIPEKSASIYDELKNSAKNTGHAPNTVNGWKNYAGQHKLQTAGAVGVGLAGAGLGARALYNKYKQRKQKA